MDDFCIFAAALFFTTYESVKGAMGLLGVSSQFNLASLVVASCCGETVCEVIHGCNICHHYERLTVAR